MDSDRRGLCRLVGSFSVCGRIKLSFVIRWTGPLGNDEVSADDCRRITHGDTNDIT